MSYKPRSTAHDKYAAHLGASVLEVCPGHSLDPSILDWARRMFGLLDGGDFMEMARRVAGAARWQNDPSRIFGAGSREAKIYDELVRSGDWPGADKSYLDWIKTLRPGLYLETLNLEGLAREFNAALAREMSRVRRIVRWMDLVELYSYLNGTLESRVEAGGKRRWYKAFSLGRNIHAKTRPACLSVPVDGEISGALRAVTYTALPRLIPPEDERIGNQKDLAYAHETECRLPDGIRVPDGTRILINRRMIDPVSVPHDMDHVLEQLRKTIEIEFV